MAPSLSPWRFPLAGLARLLCLPQTSLITWWSRSIATAHLTRLERLARRSGGGGAGGSSQPRG